jgi:hypothetical protein
MQVRFSCNILLNIKSYCKNPSKEVPGLFVGEFVAVFYFLVQSNNSLWTDTFMSYSIFKQVYVFMTNKQILRVPEKKRQSMSSKLTLRK